jgi:hypothetical protein
MEIFLIFVCLFFFFLKTLYDEKNRIIIEESVKDYILGYICRGVYPPDNVLIDGKHWQDYLTEESLSKIKQEIDLRCPRQPTVNDFQKKNREIFELIYPEYKTNESI